MEPIGYPRATKELLGVVLLRFPPVQRVWAVLLIAVNLTAIWFVGHIEAQVVVAANLIAISGMVVMYRRLGFVRLLGIAHALWIPMMVWLATRLDTLPADGALAAWLWTLLAVNSVSLIIDTVDAVRYLRGERRPHYYWQSAAGAPAASSA